MIQLELSTLAKVAALRGDLLSGYYHQALGCKDSERSLNTLLVNAIDNEAPSQHLAQDVASYVHALRIHPPDNQQPPFPVQVPLFRWILDWSCELFELQGLGYKLAAGQPALPYVGLCLRLHPFTLVSARIAKQIHEGDIGETTARTMCRETRDLCMASPQNTELLSENHLHLGGSGRSSFVLSQLLFPPEKTVVAQKSNLAPTMSYPQGFHRISTGTLSGEELVQQLTQSLRWLHMRVTGNLEQSAQDRHLPPFYWTQRPPPRSSDEIATHNSALVRNFFHFAAFQKPGDTRLLAGLVAVWLMELTHPNDLQVALRVRKVICDLNLLYNFFTMSRGVGLSIFTRFFGNDLRYGLGNAKRGLSAFDRDTIEHIFNSGIHALDAKVSWGGNNMAERAYEAGLIADEVIKAKSRAVLSILGATPAEKIQWPSALQLRPMEIFNGDASTYHFTLHFRKQVDKKRDELLDKTSESNDYIQLSVRHNAYRKELRKQTKQLVRALYHVDCRLDHLYRIHARAENLHKKFAPPTPSQDVSSLVRGLDAAGDETAAPPEVYAPFFNRIRTYVPPPGTSRTRANLTTPKPPYLSVHAGEDFSHLATGIRRVHECLVYYSMNALDSLGHGLAVGVDPEVWLHDKVRDPGVGQHPFVKAETAFEDLGWARHMIRTHTDGHRTFVARAEDLIAKLSVYLLGERPPDFSFWDFWHLKKCCPNMIEKFLSNQLRPTDEYLLASGVSLDWLDQRRNEIEVFLRYHKDFNFAHKGRTEITRIPDCETYYSHELFSPEVLRTLQELVLDEIRERGVTIECNLSSNLIISDAFIRPFMRLDQHPIFRWFPVKDASNNDKALKVTLSTDDSQIFATKLSHEYKMLANEARRRGENRLCVDKWIHQIQQNGLKLFVDRHPFFPLESRQNLRINTSSHGTRQ